jgi:hypothetical protein
MLTSAQIIARSTIKLPISIHNIIIGQLLGDAHAYRSSPTANTRIEWSFGFPYAIYANYVYEIIKLYCNTEVKPIKTGLRLKTVCLSLFNIYHEIFYVKNDIGKYVKIVPVAIIKLINAEVLAHLIIGDGSFKTSESTIFIYCNAFVYNYCVILADSIKAIGIHTTVRKDRISKDGKTQQYVLAIGPSELKTLREFVSPYIEKSILYRIGLLKIFKRINSIPYKIVFDKFFVKKIILY